MVKYSSRTEQVIVNGIIIAIAAAVVFGIGWFSAMIYSSPGCQNADIASSLLSPSKFEQGMISQVEYIEVLRMKPGLSGEVAEAAIMVDPEDIEELFGRADSSSGTNWIYEEIDDYHLKVRMVGGELVNLWVFNDSDLSGVISIANSGCLGFRGFGDADGIEDLYGQFGFGWRKLDAFMNQDSLFRTETKSDAYPD